jgi:magnesium transporter
MPVLDEQGHMVGIVTHDDALDVAIDEATEDVVRMGGAEPLEAPYFATGLLTLVRKRVIWLTILFFAGLLAGTILRVFEAVLEKEMALIYFLPLIIAAGGNSGSQSATLVIRGLATGDLRLRDWWSIGRRELSSGLLLGLLLGLLGATVSIMWGKGAISPTVFATLVSIVMFGSLLGSLLPLGLARLGIDPAITSSPLVACLVDLLGIVLYVGAAEALL